MHQDWVAMRMAFNQLVPISDEVWEAVLAIAHPTTYKKKRILLEPGQVCDRMQFIHQGAIRSY